MKNNTPIDRLQLRSKYMEYNLACNSFRETSCISVEYKFSNVLTILHHEGDQLQGEPFPAFSSPCSLLTTNIPSNSFDLIDVTHK